MTTANNCEDTSGICEFEFATHLHEHLEQLEMLDFLDLEDVLHMKNDKDKRNYYKICQYFSERGTATSLRIVMNTIDKPLKTTQRRHIMYASSSALLFSVHNWRVARRFVALGDQALIGVSKLLDYKHMDLSAIGIQVEYCMAAVAEKEFFLKMFDKNVIQKLWPAYMLVAGESRKANVCKYVAWIYLMLAELGGPECCEKLLKINADVQVALLSISLQSKPERERTNSEEFFIDVTEDLLGILKERQPSSYFSKYTKRQRLSAYMLYENEFVWTELPVYCSNPSCAKEEEEDKQKFQVCSKCRLSCYCSRDCQVEHWKEYGHKQSCRKIEDIFV